mmetsp:Transcript_950/g.948  ORF Transcript_950/g.948 Transcript_950/m.948 type:complete len:237 (-) Transcript_950:71-781(-)
MAFLFITQGIQINSLDQVIACLHHHHETIESWKSNPPTQQDLNTASSNISALLHFLTNFHQQEVAELKKQLDDANKKIKEMEETITTLTSKVDKLECELVEVKEQVKRNAQLFMLHDLNRIFRFYIAEAKLGINWGSFVESVCEMKAKLEDNEITEAEFASFISPFNLSLGFDVHVLIAFVQDRHSIGHTDIRSAYNQQKFIATCKGTHFDADLKPFVDEIIHQLDSSTISYRRMN